MFKLIINYIIIHVVLCVHTLVSSSNLNNLGADCSIRGHTKSRHLHNTPNLLKKLKKLKLAIIYTYTYMYCMYSVHVNENGNENENENLNENENGNAPKRLVHNA